MRERGLPRRRHSHPVGLGGQELDRGDPHGHADDSPKIPPQADGRGRGFERRCEHDTSLPSTKPRRSIWDVGMTPQSQRSTEAPIYAAPMGTDTSEEAGDQSVLTPMGTTGTDAAPPTEVTPFGMTATVGGAGIQIAQPSEVSPNGMATDGEAGGQPAGPEVVTPNGTTAAEGPATFDMAAEGETAEYDDCLPE